MAGKITVLKTSGLGAQHATRMLLRFGEAQQGSPTAPPGLTLNGTMP